MYMYTHMYIHINEFMCIFTHTYVYINVCVCIYIHIYMHVYMYIRMLHESTQQPNSVIFESQTPPAEVVSSNQYIYIYTYIYMYLLIRVSLVASYTSPIHTYTYMQTHIYSYLPLSNKHARTLRNTHSPYTFLILAACTAS